MWTRLSPLRAAPELGDAKADVISEDPVATSTDPTAKA
jgi:hypothetical protein